MGWKPNRGLSDFDLVITFVSSRLALIREDVLAFGARPADSKSTDPAYQFQSQQCIPRDNLPLHLPRVCWPGISGHDDEGQCRSLPFECLHGLREADSIPEVWLREYQEPGFYPAPAVPVPDTPVWRAIRFQNIYQLGHARRTIPWVRCRSQHNW
jgi:hypothetical protein